MHVWSCDNTTQEPWPEPLLHGLAVYETYTLARAMDWFRIDLIPVARNTGFKTYKNWNMFGHFQFWHLIPAWLSLMLWKGTAKCAMKVSQYDHDGYTVHAYSAKHHGKVTCGHSDFHKGLTKCISCRGKFTAFKNGKVNQRFFGRIRKQSLWHINAPLLCKCISDL